MDGCMDRCMDRCLKGMRKVCVTISIRRATTNKRAWEFATTRQTQGMTAASTTPAAAVSALEGASAGGIPDLATTEWIKRARWVHDGKFTTAAGEGLHLS